MEKKIRSKSVIRIGNSISIAFKIVCFVLHNIQKDGTQTMYVTSNYSRTKHRQEEKKKKTMHITVWTVIPVFADARARVCVSAV